MRTRVRYGYRAGFAAEHLPRLVDRDLEPPLGEFVRSAQSAHSTPKHRNGCHGGDVKWDGQVPSVEVRVLARACVQQQWIVGLEDEAAPGAEDETRSVVRVTALGDRAVGATRDVAEADARAWQ